MVLKKELDGSRGCQLHWLPKLYIRSMSRGLALEEELFIAVEKKGVSTVDSGLV